MAGVHAVAGGKMMPVETVSVQSSTYSTTTAYPSPATSSVTFGSSGIVSALADTGAEYDWLDPNGDGSGYQIKFDTTSGSLSSGTAGVWLSLGSNQTIAVTRSTVGAKTWSGTVTIRRAADMVELDSASISLQVLVESGA
jgi:hypothetical protein